MKHYELLYLVSAQVPENQIETIQTEVSDWITKAGGKITKHEQWGRRKLAYPIKKEKYGFYVLLEFDNEPETIKVLSDTLSLHKSILRFLMVIKKPISAKELLMQEQAMQRARTRALAHDDEKPRGTGKSDGESETRKVPKKESKISLEDLDKKLDELLDTNMIS